MLTAVGILCTITGGHAQEKKALPARMELSTCMTEEKLMADFEHNYVLPPPEKLDPPGTRPATDHARVAFLVIAIQTKLAQERAAKELASHQT